MRTSILTLIAFLLSTTLFSQTFIDYIEHAPTVLTFDGYSFKTENYSDPQFKIGSNEMYIDFSDTIPINVFNQFVRSCLYPRKPQKTYPIMINVKGEQKIDSIKLSSVGVLDSYNLLDKQKCYSRVIVLRKRIVSPNLLEFMLLTDTPGGIHLELYLLDRNSNRILSYVPLFQSEKLARSCSPLGKIRTASYQTAEINKGMITQFVNDSFNPLWTRRIKLNEAGYYELIWWNNPLKETVIHKVQINDPDGFTNVRSMPSTKSQVLYKIMLNEKFQVEELPEAKEWYKIFQYNDKYEGWIHKSRVTRLP